MEYFFSKMTQYWLELGCARVVCHIYPPLSLEGIKDLLFPRLCAVYS